MKHLFREEVIVEEDKLGSKKKREAVVVTSRTATDVCTLPSEKNVYISE